MPEKRPSHTSTGLLASRLQSAWRRERRARPAADRLALMGAVALGLSAVLVVAHLYLIAQLIGGLALVPLSLAAFLRLLPPPPWTEGGTGGSDDRQGDNSGGPWSPDSSASGFDWDSFERQFRAYIGEPTPGKSGNGTHRH